MMRKNEVEAYDAEINEIALIEAWVKTWISTKKATSFQMMMLKTSRNKKLADNYPILGIILFGHLFRGQGSLVLRELFLFFKEVIFLYFSY